LKIRFEQFADFDGQYAVTRKTSHRRLYATACSHIDLHMYLVRTEYNTMDRLEYQNNITGTSQYITVRVVDPWASHNVFLKPKWLPYRQEDLKKCRRNIKEISTYSLEIKCDFFSFLSFKSRSQVKILKSWTLLIDGMYL
jgi:hypothetical protein